MPPPRISAYTVHQYLPIPEEAEVHQRPKCFTQRILDNALSADDEPLFLLMTLWARSALAYDGTWLDGTSPFMDKVYQELNTHLPDGVIDAISWYDSEWYIAAGEKGFDSPYASLFTEGIDDGAIAVAIADRWHRMHEQFSLYCSPSNHWGIPWTENLPLLDEDDPPCLSQLIERELGMWRYNFHLSI